MDYLLFYLGLLVILLIYLFWEARAHEKNLAQLSLRIHVNGTRGKSSVTRLIAAGLRSGGRRVLAKTTGTEPKIIYPDGTEKFIKRRGPANIKENIKVMKIAVQQGADAVVLECMALRPELQKFCEQRLVQAQIGVITNIRADHEDVMGKGLLSVAKALSNTIPQAGVLVTTPAAAALLTKVQPQVNLVVAEAATLQQEFLQGFPFVVIPENLALALKVCQLAGVTPEVAVQGMRQSQPDAGNLHLVAVREAGREFTFVDALAANDPESTLWLWQQYMPEQGAKAILLNCRADRQYRSRQLCAILAKLETEAFILTGDTLFAQEALQQAGVNKNKIFILPAGAMWQDLLAILVKLPGEVLSIFAAGNIKGLSDNLRDKLSGG